MSVNAGIAVCLFVLGIVPCVITQAFGWRGLAVYGTAVAAAFLLGRLTRTNKPTTAETTQTPDKEQQ